MVRKEVKRESRNDLNHGVVLLSIVFGWRTEDHGRTDLCQQPFSLNLTRNGSDFDLSYCLFATRHFAGLARLLASQQHRLRY